MLLPEDQVRAEQGRLESEFTNCPYFFIKSFAIENWDIIAQVQIFVLQQSRLINSYPQVFILLISLIIINLLLL